MFWKSRLRIGGEVLIMSPAGSCFCRAMRRRMIQDSTRDTRAAVEPTRTTSSSSCCDSLPMTGSFRRPM